MASVRADRASVGLWHCLLSDQRLRKSRVTGSRPVDARTEFENDFDRVIFSSSFRRLRNKAQVFSLEPHDFVRTRLTHSFEVATIGRSLGEGATRGLWRRDNRLDFLVPRDVGTIVATACLLHDIGNPPFGHSGERAIGAWFAANIDAQKRIKLPDPEERADLCNFEGNAQSFRIATRLQWSGQDFGMNLTAATLSALVKYPCGSHEVCVNGPKALKKFGYFKSDAVTFGRVRSLTGLDGSQRNPLTYLMEAADDIAYATGDIEDVLKKGLVDYQTIRQTLKAARSVQSRDCVKRYLDEPYSTDFRGCDMRERQQLSLQRFSQMAIRLMVKSAIEAFLSNYVLIIRGNYEDDLVTSMSMSDLCRQLKKIMEDYVYSHVEIAHREQTARNVIAGLLSAIVDELQDRPDGPLARLTYRAAPVNTNELNNKDGGDLSAAYKVAQRATDYVSGMTDGHALAQYQRISGMRASF